MPEPRPLTAVVADHDLLWSRAMSALLEELGFEIVGHATNSVEAIREAELGTPSLVVLGNEMPGLSGLEVVPDLRGVPDAPEVLLVAADQSARDDAKAAGAHDVALRGDTDMQLRMLTEIKEILVTGERRGGDRRTGGDRRKEQDWSKVTHERRSGGDRRDEGRRDQERRAGDNERRQEQDWRKVTSERRTGDERRRD